MAALAQLIRRRRLDLRLTQRAAARQAGVSLATWQNLERTDSQPDGFQELTLARVAHGLSLDLATVFEAAGRDLPHADGALTDPLRPPDDPPINDVEGLLSNLARILRELAAASPDSFLLVYGQATETADHLLRTRTADRSDGPDTRE